MLITRLENLWYIYGTSYDWNSNYVAGKNSLCSCVRGARARVCVYVERAHECVCVRGACACTSVYSCVVRIRARVCVYDRGITFPRASENARGNRDMSNRRLLPFLKASKRIPAYFFHARTHTRNTDSTRTEPWTTTTATAKNAREIHAVKPMCTLFTKITPQTCFKTHLFRRSKT